MKLTSKKISIVVAVWQALSFVLMGVWARMMNDSFTTYQQVFWRFLIAAVVAWVIFGHKFSASTFRLITKKDWFIYFLRSALNYGVGVMLFTFAVLHTDLALVSFVSSLPIMGLLAWLMFREKLDKKALPYIIFSVIGLVLITGVSSGHFTIGVGMVAAVTSMLGFDISYLMVKYHPKKLTNFHNTTIMLTFAWVIPLLLLVIKKQSVLPSHISSVAFIGLCASVIFNITGLYALNYVFKNLKGYVAGNILLLEGVFAVFIGYLFYDEKLHLDTLFGAVIIILSAIAVSRINLKTEKAPEGEF